MKKLISLVLTLVLALTLGACGIDNNNGEDMNIETPDVSTDVTENDGAEADTGNQDITAQEESVNIAGLKGPTSMGLVKLLSDSEEGLTINKYNVTKAGNADEIAPRLIKGELDMAAVPANLASVLYNNTNGGVKILAVNTLGVVYIVEKGGEVAQLSDLVGKTVYATGKGQTPEYTLRYILEENGIDPDNDLTIEFKSEPTEVVAILNNSEKGVAMLPQPYVTVAGNTVEGLTTVVDLNAEWEALGTESMLVTGVIVARSEFVENNPNTVKAFLEEYKKSVEFATENVDEAASLIEKYGIVKAPIAKKALPFCNIRYIDGQQMKQAVSGYLTVLGGQNIKAVGGALPDDNFYYIAE